MNAITINLSDEAVEAFVRNYSKFLVERDKQTGAWLMTAEDVSFGEIRCCEYHLWDPVTPRDEDKAFIELFEKLSSELNSIVNNKK